MSERNTEPTIIVTGPVGCGKSAVMEIIYKALRDAGLHPYSEDLAHERRMVNDQPEPAKVWHLTEKVAAPAEAGNAIEDRNVWKRVVPPVEVGAEPDAERQFPMQDGPPIPWSLARAIYAGYVALFGCEQSLDRIAERQGFGWSEVPFLYGRPQSRAAIDAAMNGEKA
jgi:hypothetical protein